MYTEPTKHTDADEEFDDDSDEKNLCDEDLRVYCNDPDLEAYGPVLQPLDHASLIVKVTEDENCSICMKHYTFVSVQLKTCGHFSHYRCLHDWFNGTSPNSNLCPECHARICKRKKVRFAGDGDDEMDGVEYDDVYGIEIEMDEGESDWESGDEGQ
jgi:hypothetical protein